MGESKRKDEQLWDQEEMLEGHGGVEADRKESEGC